MDLHKTFLLALLLASKFLGKSAFPDKFCYLSGNTDFSKPVQVSKKKMLISFIKGDNFTVLLLRCTFSLKRNVTILNDITSVIHKYF